MFKHIYGNKIQDDQGNPWYVVGSVEECPHFNQSNRLFAKRVDMLKIVAVSEEWAVKEHYKVNPRRTQEYKVIEIPCTSFRFTKDPTFVIEEIVF